MRCGRLSMAPEERGDVQPRDGTAEALADVIEARLLIRDARAVSVDALPDLLGSPDRPRIDMAVNVMHRRAVLLGSDRYPFRTSAVGLRVARRTRASSPYEALLLMSLADSPCKSAARVLQEAAAHLEDLGVEALRGLLGPESRALRFGWPSEVGRPREFPEAIGWLSDEMGIRSGAGYRHPRRQDGGVDVVAWRPFPDHQPGFPIVLAQATLERDFVHKSRDIDLRLWAGWLAFDVDPLTALVIPYTVPSDEAWREMSSTAIVLDRLRIVGLLGHAGSTSESSTAWVNQELERWRA